MKKLVIAAMFLLLIPSMSLAQAPYMQDFEAMAPVDGSMAGDGWFVYMNIFNEADVFQYGWGYPAPNNIGNIDDIVSGEGGPDQGAQQLVMYSDYGAEQHGWLDWTVETNLYREWPVNGGEGMWYFAFDAKMGNLEAPSEAFAFIKVLDPNAGWATTQFITADMTNASTTWARYGLEVDLSGSAGQIVQIGFMSTASNYGACGVFYDNLDFGDDPAVSTQESSLSRVKSLY
jgi:hypothetical protein